MTPPSKGGDGNDADLAALEEVFQTMDVAAKYLSDSMSTAEVQRLKELDKKHCEYYFRTMKKSRGPQPTAQETLEYKQSIPIRLRTMGPAQSRVKLAEHSEGDQFDKYWGVLENAYADMNTYQYAWIGLIMNELEHMQQALQAIRVLLVYADALLTNPKYRSARKALQVLNLSERAIDEIRDSMTEETGEERWDLSYQEYKQELYTCLAFAALGNKELSIEYFRSAASDEQGQRLQARTEYQHRKKHDKASLKEFQATLQQFDTHVSVLHVISQVLAIPRGRLDMSYYLDNKSDDTLDNINNEDMWKCILTFDYGWLTDPVDYCEKCWVAAPIAKLKKCSRCQKAAYCSKVCQLDDWKDHKMDCSPKVQQQYPTSLMKIKSEVIPE